MATAVDITHPTGMLSCCLSMELIRLGGPAHGIVTKTVHKKLPGGGGGPRDGGGPGGGWVGDWWQSRGRWAGGDGGPQVGG